MRRLLTLLAPTALSIVLWFALLLAALALAEHSGDSGLNLGRVWPYTHAHLTEEYFEGQFHPERDTLFLAASFLRNFGAFGLGAWLLMRSRPALAQAIAFVLVCGFFLSSLWFGLMLPPMYGAFALEAGFGALGGITGGVFGSLSRRGGTA